MFAALLALALVVEDEASLREHDPFPPPETVAAWCEFNVAYRLHLDQELELEPWESERAAWLRAARSEAFELWWLWDCARLIHEDRWRRDLREKIGPEAYRAGRLPAPVPFWRFRNLD